MSAGHGGMEKCGTRAHQARVPQKVVDPKLFPKQCSISKNIKKTWYWAILAHKLGLLPMFLHTLWSGPYEL